MKIDLSRKLSHKPETTKPQASSIQQSWATTNPRVSTAATPKPKRKPKGWVDGKGWTGSQKRVLTSAAQQRLQREVDKHNASQRRPRRLSATNGVEELGLDGKWRAVKQGRKVGRRKYEGYSFKTHHAVAEVTPTTHESGLKPNGTDGANAKRKVTGSYSHDGAFRPSRKK